MNRFTVRVIVEANIGVGALSPEAAELFVKALCNQAAVMSLSCSEFVIEKAEVVEVLDVDWNKVSMSQALARRRRYPHGD